MGSEQEIESMIKLWQDFVDRYNQGHDEKIILNPDKERVKKLATGILNNEINHGLKYCPCRMTTGRPEDDIKLVCPCFFAKQKVWQTKGECWCSLFIKK
jgi:ferredoxin-thioredoxin reductase catalytic chain